MGVRKATKDGSSVIPVVVLSYSYSYT